jgi:hypothetical protein
MTPVHIKTGRILCMLRDIFIAKTDKQGDIICNAMEAVKGGPYRLPWPAPDQLRSAVNPSCWMLAFVLKRPSPFSIHPLHCELRSIL